MGLAPESEFDVDLVISGLEDGVLFYCDEDGDDAAFVLTTDEMLEHRENGRIDVIGAMKEISELRGDKTLTLKKVFDATDGAPVEIAAPSVKFSDGKQQFVM